MDHLAIASSSVLGLKIAFLDNVQVGATPDQLKGLGDPAAPLSFHVGTDLIYLDVQTYYLMVTTFGWRDNL